MLDLDRIEEVREVRTLAEVNRHLAGADGWRLLAIAAGAAGKFVYCLGRIRVPALKPAA